ncbi:MAG TPA: hypothetical protein VF627_13375 [Abditibacterium sp.]|jgi:nucleoside phosphorylase
MNKNQISILAGVLLIVGLVNAWVLHTGFAMLQDKRFYSSSSTEAPVVTALSGNRFIIVDDNQARIFRVNSAGQVTMESRAVAGEGYNFQTSPLTPTP